MKVVEGFAKASKENIPNVDFHDVHQFYGTNPDYLSKEGIGVSHEVPKNCVIVVLQKLPRLTCKCFALPSAYRIRSCNMILSVIASYFWLAVGYFFKSDYGDLVVRIDSGKVRGFELTSRDGRPYQAWTGIPYAQPPVGNLRFKAPKPAQSWEGVHSATTEPRTCLDGTKQFPNGTENCLYLNVYRPKISKRNLPVIFYVHGGGFQTGYLGPKRSADYLMDEDVVLVRIQYRLGVFGFMSLGDSVMPGNFGLKDQVMALKWVKRNIAAFGGNPDSITAIGESAGGASTHILLKSPACDDLVHRAVSDSGTINKVWSLLHPEVVKASTLKAVEKLQCLKKTSKEILQCLQKLDSSTILNIAPKDLDPTKEPYQLFLPVIEPVDAEDPVATFDLSLRPTEKPWITSVCTGEWILFKRILGKNNQIRRLESRNDTISYLVKYLSQSLFNKNQTNTRKVAEIVGNHYFPPAGSATDNAEALFKMFGDLYFLYPAVANIRGHKGPKWIYRLENNGKVSQAISRSVHYSGNDVFHASQSSIYFNMRERVGLSNKESQEDKEVSKRMIKYLVNFAYYDNPTPDSPRAYDWEQFSGSEVLSIRNGDSHTVYDGIEELTRAYDLWHSILG